MPSSCPAKWAWGCAATTLPGSLSPHPPAIAGRAVPAKDIDAGGAAAALDALRIFEALIERWDESPPALTRAGGLPVRELRAAAKALAASSRKSSR